MLLHRYQPINKNTLENLIHKMNWASNPCNFNDPFEFQLRSNFIININGRVEYISDEENIARENIIKYISGFGIVSYSETENNILLWSHYSDNHKGMCLVFDVPDILSKDIYKVDYEDLICPIEFKQDVEILGVLKTKSKAWSYEKEHRQIFKIGERHYYYPNILKEIIFGCQASLKDIEMVVKICESIYENKLIFSKMFIQEDTFNLGKSSVTSNIDEPLPKFWMKNL